MSDQDIRRAVRHINGEVQADNLSALAEFVSGLTPEARLELGARCLTIGNISQLLLRIRASRVELNALISNVYQAIRNMQRLIRWNKLNRTADELTDQQLADGCRIYMMKGMHPPKDVPSREDFYRMAYELFQRNNDWNQWDVHRRRYYSGL